MKPASEPTDIIWEHRHFTKGQRFFKKLLVSIVIFVLLSISASLIYKFSTLQQTYKNKYPKVNCEEIES